MGVAKKTRKFGAVKRKIGQNDAPLKKNKDKGEREAKKKEKADEVVTEVPQVSSALLFQYNAALVSSVSTLSQLLFAGRALELEKLGPRYRIALRTARDERFERLQCYHKGVYADDCIVDRRMKNKIYIVIMNDRDLKRRVRKIRGVPIVCGKKEVCH